MNRPHLIRMSETKRGIGYSYRDSRCPFSLFWEEELGIRDNARERLWRVASQRRHPVKVLILASEVGQTVRLHDGDNERIPG